MSDTPRTDEEIKHYGGLQRVSADFARKLERELIKIADLVELLRDSPMTLTYQLEKWAAKFDSSNPAVRGDRKAGVPCTGVVGSLNQEDGK
jgi:hypothetical protein